MPETPTEYYTSRYSGEEIDRGIDGALQLGGATTKQQALRNIGGRPSRNLLDNWYFVHPINQRGISSQNPWPSNAYGIDRWTLYGSNVSLENGYIYFPAGVVPTQVLDPSLYNSLAGKVATFSYLMNDGNLVTGTATITNGATTLFVNNSEGQSYINAEGGLQFYRNAEFGCIAVKLELGSQQTLAYQDEEGNWQLFETPDYGEELAKCQRYYLPIDNRGRFPAIFSSPSTTLQVFVPTPVTMRVNPTVQGITSISARVYSGSANSQSLSVSQALLTEAGVLITFSVTWPSTLNPYSCAIVVFGGNGALSAEL